MRLDLGLNLGIQSDFRKALDFLSIQSSAAYSLRKLRSAYTGSAIRVRRSLDNSEQDIGFSGTDLDTTALQAFVGNENLLRHSEAFENAVWEGLSGATETINVNTELAPDGTMTADRCTVLGGSSGRFQQVTLSSAGQVTLSTYIKVGSSGTWARVGIFDTGSPSNQARCWVNMATGELGTVAIVGVGWTGVSATSVSVGNGWYRVSITATCIATAISVLIANAAGDNDTNRAIGSNRILWGTQLNQGTLQPYSPTTTTANTANGFVTIWYDQSGNGRNATQATAGNQPIIVNNSVLETTIAGKPTIRFTASPATTLVTPSFSGSIEITVAAVTRFNLAGSYPIMYGTADTTSGHPELRGVSSSGKPSFANSFTNEGAGVLSSPATPIAGTTSLVNVTSILIGDANNGTFRLRQDGVLKDTKVTTASPTTNTSRRIGARVSLAFPLNGFISEAIEFSALLSTTDTQILERNLGSQYGVTIP